MTSSNETPEKPAQDIQAPLSAARAVKRQRSALTPWLLLLLVALLAGGGWFSYQFLLGQWRQMASLQQSLLLLDQRSTEMQAQQAEVIEAAQKTTSAIAGFDSRLEGYDKAATRLAGQVQGGRERFQLAAVENLLIAANERVQLQRDVRGAITALELADQRLSALSEPRLFKLREAIAQERAALVAVQSPDLTAVALTLSSLINRVPQLSLRARVPDHIEVQQQTLEAQEGDSWAQRMWAGALEALNSVFSVRRTDGPAPRLLAPEQEAMVFQMLLLKLEGARLAMLRDDADSYRDLCDSATSWLNDYFRSDDPNVLAARAELERLKDIKLDTPLPDITRSLTLLRAYLETSAQ